MFMKGSKSGFFEGISICGRLHEPGIYQIKVVAGDVVILPLQAERAFKPGFSGRVISGGNIVLADKLNGRVAVRVEFLCFLKVRGGLADALEPIQTHPVAQKGVAFPGIELLAALEPDQSLFTKFTVIGIAYGTLNSKGFADP